MPHQHIIQFLEALRKEGFTIGVDSHLQVWTILKSLPKDIDEAAYNQTVEDYLCPLFSQNEREQTKFKKVFADYADLLQVEAITKEEDKESKTEKTKVTEQETLKRPSLRKYFIGGLIASIILALLGIGLYQYLKPPPVLGCMDEKSITFNPDAEIDDGSCQYIDTNYVCLDSEMFNYTDTTGKSSPTTIYLPCEDCCSCAGCTDDRAINYNEKACEDDGSCEFPKQDTPIEKARKDSTTYKVPFEKRPVDLPNLKPINNRLDYQIYQAKTPISIFLLVLLIGLWLARWLYQRKQKSYNAARNRGEEPPFTLPIKITNDKGIIFDEQIQTVFRDMRGRESSNLQRINIKKTIDATIRQGGLLDIQYRFRSRPTEYLILIDKNTDQNHQSQLFEHIYQMIKEEEVQAARFFFDDDIRICWNDDHPSGISIERLVHLYSEARLMIFSNGYSFINRKNNETAKWLKPLEHWQRRALMTPAPMAAWNYREGILAQVFMVLPSSIEGLMQVVEHFETLKESDLKSWKYKIGKTDQPLQLDKDNLIQSLEAHFDKKMMRWIVACAVYPDLHWDLTVRIGHALSKGDTTIVTHQNLIEIARLPWFQRGYMSNEVRHTLLDYDGFTDEDRLIVRAAIVEVLEENIPTNKNSFAFEEHQMQLAINQLLLNKIGEDNKKWLELYQEQYNKGVQEDRVAIEELNKKNNKILGFELPQNFTNAIFRDGRALLGLNNKFALSGLIAGMLLVLVFQFLWKVDCFEKDNTARIGEDLYCLSNIQDTIDFYILNSINYNKTNLGYRSLNDSLSFDFNIVLKELDRNKEIYSDIYLQVGDRKIIKPVYTAFYNNLLRLYNSGDYETINTFYSEVKSFASNEWSLAIKEEREYQLIKLDIEQITGLAAFYINDGNTLDSFRLTIEGIPDTILQWYFQQNVPNLYHFLQYDFVDSMVEDRVRVRKDGKYGFLDSLGMPMWTGDVLPYDYANNYNEGTALITEGTRQCLIDKAGQQIGACFTELIAKQDPSTQLWGYKNERDVWVIAPAYEVAKAFEPNYAVVKKDGKFGMIDKSNSVVLPIQYDEIGDFQILNDIARTRIGNLYGFVSNELRLIILPKYSAAKNFEGKTNPTAEVTLDGREIVIDGKGECIRNCGNANTKIDIRVEITVIDNDGNRLSDATVALEDFIINYDNEGDIESATDEILNTNSNGSINRTLTYLSASLNSINLLAVKDGYKDFETEVTITNNVLRTTIRLEKEGTNSKIPLPQMVALKGGTFTMGSNDGREDEKPPHQVTLSDFSIGKYEVTNEEYAAFLNAKGNQVEGGETWINIGGSFSNEKCRILENGKVFSVESGYEKHPVIYVSWYGARAYCNWLKEETGQNYRLPTEAEWEYAARGGNRPKNYIYSGSDNPDEVGWYYYNSANKTKTHQVGTKRANELGIFDMSGNVYEWCSDWYDEKYYANSQNSTNPQGAANGDYRVVRGGSWLNNFINLRVAYRDGAAPDGRDFSLGFRCLRAY